MSHSSELEMIRFIQEYRTPFLDEFFKFLNYFDRPEFFFVLVPMIWLGKGWKWGFRLFYILFLCSLAIHGLKDLFHLPRPFHVDPSVALIHVNGYGLPSGAAASSILLSGLMINYWKSRWKWCVAIVYVALVSFSRIYLGVHYFTDLLGGWIVGLSFWALFTYVRRPLEKRLEKLKPLTLFCLSQLIPIAILFWHYSINTFGAMGLGIGLFLNYSYGWSLPPSKTTQQFITRAAIGVIGTFLWYSLMKLMPLPKTPFMMFWQSLLLSLWITTGSLLLCRKLKLA